MLEGSIDLPELGLTMGGQVQHFCKRLTDRPVIVGSYFCSVLTSRKVAASIRQINLNC